MQLEFYEQIVKDEIAGKNMAIHAYDKMLWTVRSGFLTLVFGGWGLIIKTAIEKELSTAFLLPYATLLIGFTLVLALGAYLIDRNYSRRKFRVIFDVNNFLLHISPDRINDTQLDEKIRSTFLRISGDASNDNYKMEAFYAEMLVGKIIYLSPIVLIFVMYLAFSL